MADGGWRMEKGVNSRGTTSRGNSPRRVASRLLKNVNIPFDWDVTNLEERERPIVLRPLLTITILLALAVTTGHAFEQLTIVRDEERYHVVGELVVEAADGGLLLLAADGTLWAIQPDEIVERTSNDTALEPMEADALAHHLLEEMPEGFHVHQTAHYLIVYNTSRNYAQWVGGLYERLYRGFYNYWTHRGHDLHEPSAPLIALVFDDRAAYIRYGQEELGDAAGAIIGYYSLRTNRTASYDLTGVEGAAGQQRRTGSTAQINRILARPEAQILVATIIHEATHQLAYNSGLQTRYADNPLWLSEGLAIYFETPDLRSGSGWRSIGVVNGPRLELYQRNLRTRPDNALETLLSDDARFRDPAHVLDAYSEAWALSYFLIQRYPEPFQAYMAELAEKKPLLYDEPEERLRLFREHFGDDLARLDEELVHLMMRLRP